MKQVGRRSILFACLFSAVLLVLLYRVMTLQLAEAEVLRGKAESIWIHDITLMAKRGTLYDRNREKLAYDKPAYTVTATLSPKADEYVSDVPQTAAQLASVLDVSPFALQQQMQRNAYEVELRQGGYKIDNKKAEQVQALDLPGISVREESSRFYPNQRLASYVLGYVDLDGKARMGLEAYYDKWLTGTPGRYQFSRDRRGIQLPEGELMRIPPKDGGSLVLTIDQNIQAFAEEALDRVVAEYQPKSAMAIVADPFTGEIYAMANRPDFNPNRYWEIENFSNLNVSSQFEPGSTFKIVTLSAAVEAGLFKPNEQYKSGTYKVPGKVIRDHNNGRGWGTISFLEGVQRSSNVAFTILGERLGKERLFRAIHDFGFGEPTGIDLPGEQAGKILSADKAYPLDLAAASFGQGVSVTPIQQIAAVSAVANGGMLPTPHVVSSQLDSAGNEKKLEYAPVRRVISEETAAEVRRILETVVDDGSGAPAYLTGYRVAGKTGTAQKYDQHGKIVKDENIVSFIGFAPSDKPRLIAYVAIDAPQVEGEAFGSTVAAPVFRDIMRNSLHYLRVPQTNTTEPVPGR